MGKIIGISGKIGSGKNYLAEKIMQELEFLGHTTAEGSFAAGLRNELDRIIKTIKVEVLDGQNGSTIVEKLHTLYNFDADDAEIMYSCLVNDVVHVDGLNANSRTESIRRALQILGTDIRRKQENNYWVNLFFKTLPEADYIIVTDVRFPNEADAVLQNGGKVIRLDLDDATIEKRIQNRDGLKYSDEAKTHPSEIALDDYPKFSLYVGAEFNAKTVVTQLLNLDDIPKRIEEHGV